MPFPEVMMPIRSYRELIAWKKAIVLVTDLL